jgi:hypothetical protein
VQPVAHRPLQDMLLVSNRELSFMLHMLHLITNTAACLQLQQLCSWKQNSCIVLCFIVAQISTIPLRCQVRLNKVCLKS